MFVNGVWWCWPIVLDIQEAEVGGSVNPGVGDQPNQHSKTLSHKTYVLICIFNFYL
jgi:hypothetical protein